MPRNKQRVDKWYKAIKGNPARFSKIAPKVKARLCIWHLLVIAFLPTPEHALALAVITQTIDDLTNPNLLIRLDAEQYIQEVDDLYLDAIGLDLSYIHLILKEFGLYAKPTCIN